MLWKIPGSEPLILEIPNARLFKNSSVHIANGSKPTVGDIGAGVGQFGAWLIDQVRLALFLVRKKHHILSVLLLSEEKGVKWRNFRPLPLLN